MGQLRNLPHNPVLFTVFKNVIKHCPSYLKYLYNVTLTMFLGGNVGRCLSIQLSYGISKPDETVPKRYLKNVPGVT